ncbi:hypothetical protein K438DRAFT_1726644 [Mycena galopus ATCC 62051]|nr:hypothetical protein K438DRAFT_1726644 [Mycena galopus ATCC 62051]
MARTTRSGAQWSPWELDKHVTFIAPDICQSRVALRPFLQAAVEAEQTRAICMEQLTDDDENEWEDLAETLSHPPTPLSRPSTPLSASHVGPSGFSRSPCPLSESPPSPGPSQPSYKQRQKAGHKARRRRVRVAQAQTARFGPVSKSQHDQHHREHTPYSVPTAGADIRRSGLSGNWTGPRSAKKTKVSCHTYRRLKELLQDDFDLVQWDGRNPKLIVDAEGQIIAVLLGRPEGDNWEDVIQRMEQLLDQVRTRGLRRDVFAESNKRHRRGNFHVLKAGFTKGLGQKKPGNLAHAKEYRRPVDIFLSNRATRRVGGFQSSSLTRYAPKLYQYQCSTMQRILDDQPEIEAPLGNSVFPTITANLGPSVVTPEHLDMLNNAFSMCAVTSAGKFDHTKGGHIFLRQLRLLREFPSGSTILLLSAICEHGNTPIQKSETRYSITQYMAGTLFRWAEYGHKSVKTLLSQPGGAAQKASIDGGPSEWVVFGWGLLSLVHELQVDWEAVFGGN